MLQIVRFVHDLENCGAGDPRLECRLKVDEVDTVDCPA